MGKNGFLGSLVLILTGLFVAGKIFGFLSWSWWLVFLPVILFVCVPMGIVAAVLIAGGIFVVLVFAYYAVLTAYNELRRWIRGLFA